MSNTDNIMVTTLDNPINPFTNFEEWLSTDIALGYNTCGVLARLAKVSEELSDTLNEEEIDSAMNEMTNGIFKGIFVKVSPESYKDDGTIVPVQ